jgi:cytochrome bd-type quinol oxidase subunit 2
MPGRLPFSIGAVLIGATWLGSQLIAAELLQLIALPAPPQRFAHTATLPWLLAAAVVVGTSLAAAQRLVRASRRGELLVWMTLLLLNGASLVLEGAIFAPELIGESVPFLLLQQSLASVATALVVVCLGPRHRGPSQNDGLVMPRAASRHVSLPPPSHTFSSTSALALSALSW